MSEQHAKAQREPFRASRGLSAHRPIGRRAGWDERDRHAPEDRRENKHESISGVLAELQWGREG